MDDLDQMWGRYIPAGLENLSLTIWNWCFRQHILCTSAFCSTLGWRTPQLIFKLTFLCSPCGSSSLTSLLRSEQLQRWSFSSVTQLRSSALFFTVLFISAPAVRGCQRSMGNAQEGRLAGWLWMGTSYLVRTGPPSVPPPTAAAWQKSSGEACWLQQQLLGTTEEPYT